MPPVSRSQRRRQPARTQQRRAGERSSSAGQTTERIGAARPVTRRAPEPIDYSLDYTYARQDLLRIALWGGLLFAGMLAYYFIF